MKMICEELGIDEKDLEAKTFESFKEPGLPSDMQKNRYEWYEAKRKEKLKQIKKVMQERGLQFDLYATELSSPKKTKFIQHSPIQSIKGNYN